MLYVDKNNNIRLTRGDTAKFVVSVQNESIKEPYDILSSDTLTMTIKDSIRDGEPCVQKTIASAPEKRRAVRLYCSICPMSLWGITSWR